MNPKNLSQMDPKLQEAYNRVMGTTVNNPPQEKAAAAPPANASSSPTPPHLTPVAHMETVSSPIVTTHVFKNPVLTAKKEKAITGKKFHVPLFIWIILIVLFFAVYGVVWVKVFNLSVPYLNP